MVDTTHTSDRILLATVAFVVLAVALSAPPAGAQSSSGTLLDDPLGTPMRVRDFTLPSFLTLGFAPAPAAPLGRGASAFEIHFSKVNDFQMSTAVEAYLQQKYGGHRHSLDASDAAAIASLPAGEGFFIDGEFDFYDFAVHYGITDRLDVALQLSYIHYGGGILDRTIYDFHRAFGLGQQGRTYVTENRFQAIFGADGVTYARWLEAPSRGGFSDPSVFLRYAIPGDIGGFRFSLMGGVKPPLASVDRFLSTGSWDWGGQLTAETRSDRDALIFNLAVVFPGAFKPSAAHDVRFEPPTLPSLDVAWLHRLHRWPATTSFVQLLFAEHPLRRLVDSAVSRLEFQATFGLKWHTADGMLAFGLTENLFNFENTPDIGVHLGWGTLVP